MATSKFTAAESIKRLAVQFQDMVAAADALEAIGSVEQATQEAIAARAIAENDRDRALKERDEAKAAIKKHKDDAAKLLSDAKESGTAVIAQAESNAAKMIEEAKAQALAIVQAAQSQANDVVSGVSSKVLTEQLRLDAITKEIADFIAQRDNAEVEAKAAQAKLDKVQDTIKKLAGV